MRGLNWGCGPVDVWPEGWTGSDIEDFGQEHVGNILNGLPWNDGTFDVVHSQHALTQLPFAGLRYAIDELTRVLAPGGVIRLEDADPAKAFKAYQLGNESWFPNGDESVSLDEKFCAWMNWFSTRQSIITKWYAMQLLQETGEYVVVSNLPVTPGLPGLGDRPDESWRVSAMKR